MKQINLLVLYLTAIFLVNSCTTSFWIIEGDYDTYAEQSLEGFRLALDAETSNNSERYSIVLDKSGQFIIRIPKREDLQIMVRSLSFDGIERPWMDSKLELEPRVSNDSRIYKLEMDDDRVNIGKAYIYNHIKVEYTGPKIVNSLDEISAKWNDAVPNVDMYTVGLADFQGLTSGVSILNIQDRYIDGATITTATIVKPPLLPSKILSMDPYYFREPVLLQTKYQVGVAAYYYDEIKDEFIMAGANYSSIGPYDFEYQPEQ